MPTERDVIHTTHLPGELDVDAVLEHLAQSLGTLIFFDMPRMPPDGLALAHAMLGSACVNAQAQIKGRQQREAPPAPVPERRKRGRRARGAATNGAQPPAEPATPQMFPDPPAAAA
jgi:hypothetical protein